MTLGRMQAVAAATAAAAAVATASFLPKDALSVWRDTRNGAATSHARRELAPAHTVGILAPNAIVAAAHVIPRDATYYVAAGTHAPETTADARFYVGFFAAFWLLPRRAAPTPQQARWVLSYGADIRSLGVRFSRVVPLGPGVTAAQVER